MYRYPDGVTLAIFYPELHEFRFMEWGSDSNWSSEPVEGNIATSVGMVYDTLRKLSAGLSVPTGARYPTAKRS